jgi:CheY-like chemotaxis protein
MRGGVSCVWLTGSTDRTAFYAKREKDMPESEILKDKLILAVDDEEDVLETIREELSDYPGVKLHTATTFEKGREYIVSFTYDLVILDIMGVRGFDLLRIAANQKMPVVMLTAHALNPEALKESIEKGARAYLPKDKLGSLTPFLEDVLKLNYQVAVLFDKKFGSTWRKSEEEFWGDFEKKLEMEEAVIIK